MIQLRPHIVAPNLCRASGHAQLLKSPPWASFLCQKAQIQKY